MAYTKTLIIGACAAALLGACATPQNNPYAKYSSKMPAEQTQQYAQNTVQPPAQAPITYQDPAVQSAGYTQSAGYPQAATHQASTHQAGVRSSSAHQECLSSETNRKIAGAAIGGAIGAYAGKKLGGDDKDTAGMLAGAAVGGIAGYGVGGMTKDCDQYSAAQPVQAVQTVVYPAQTQQVTTAVSYQEAPAYQQPAMIETGGQNLSQAEMRSIDAYQYNSGGYVTGAAATAPAPQTTQRLYDIPAQAALPAAPAPQSVAAQGVTYIVQEGDTAWNLSRRTCSSVADIKAMNSLEGDFLIKAGEAIRLPASTC